jgi:hypothetical protein
MKCDEAQLQLGADPEREDRDLEASLAMHLAECAGCRSYRGQMQSFNRHIRRALELSPVATGAAPAPAVAMRRLPVAWRAPRWLPLAASVVLAVGAAVLLWPAQSTPALAAELTEHIAGGDEFESWSNRSVVPKSALDFVLRDSGVSIDTRGAARVVYAHSCELRGRLVPHLVLHDERGTFTVVPLVGERLAEPQKFRERGLSGVLLPVSGGAIAVLAQGSVDVNAAATAIERSIRLRTDNSALR